MDISVEEHANASSQDFAETSIADAPNPVEKVPTPVLSPEKSLFGNSADRLRESDMEAIISNGNTSSNGNETITNGTNGNNHLSELESTGPETEDISKNDSLEDKTDVSNDDSIDTSKEDHHHDKDKVDANKSNIEDKAGEDTCVRREFTPLTDKEAHKGEEDICGDVAEEDTTMEGSEKVTEDETRKTADEKDNVSKDESTMEVDVAPTSRRSNRRSANVTPAKPTKAIPKTTPKSAKNSKATPASEKLEVAVEEKADEDIEMSEDNKQQEENAAETPTASSRRSLRTSKATPKETITSKTKTPASTKSKKTKSTETEEFNEDNVLKPEEEKVEEPTSNRRRSTRAAAVKKEPPAKSIKKEDETKSSNKLPPSRGTKRGAASKTDTENEDGSDDEVKTPTAKKVKKEDNEEEMETKGVTPRRSSARSKAAVSTPAAKTPKATTPKRIKKESEKAEDDVEMEIEKEEGEKEESSKAVKTPKRAPQKKGAAATEKVGSSKAKSRKRNVSEPTDPLDPFNFDAKKDEHPELFKSVHVERSSFGNIKFFKNTKTDTSSKYASMEKNATERRSLMPEQTPGSSKTKTPRTSAKKTPASRQRGGVKKEDDASIDEPIGFDEDEISKTPKTKASKNDNSTVVKTPKVEEQAPKLTEEEQILADDESNPHFPSGARVYAIWGKEYYSAIIGDIDGLGRYKVFYTEDQSIRNIPKAGVIPIHLVKEGCRVTILGERDEDNERSAYEGKVISIPSIKNAEEWHRGLYSIEIEDTESEKCEVKWFDIYFTEAQYKQIIKNIKNPTAVDQDNVIDSGRRTRRSTVAAATPASASTPLAAKAKTPAKPKATPKSKNAASVVEEANNTEEIEDSQKTSENNAKAESQASDNTPSQIFNKMQFILTSANRHTGPPPFTKKEVKKQIESRSGSVIETFETIDPNLTTYLIADTYYRTHKYLTALSLSIPTVSFKWIEKCVEENKLVDNNEFMLDAGESDITGEVYKWKPLKGELLNDKKITVYSDRQPTESRAINFVQIWSPIIKNLGAELVDNYPSNINETIEFFKNKGAVEYFIADDGTNQEIINAVVEGGGEAVTSEWIIQTIITGNIAQLSGNEAYRILPKP